MFSDDSWVALLCVLGGATPVIAIQETEKSGMKILTGTGGKTKGYETAVRRRDPRKRGVELYVCVLQTILKIFLPRCRFVVLQRRYQESRSLSYIYLYEFSDCSSPGGGSRKSFAGGRTEAIRSIPPSQWWDTVISPYLTARRGQKRILNIYVYIYTKECITVGIKRYR